MHTNDCVHIESVYKKSWYHRKDGNIKILQITSLYNIQMLSDAKCFVS